MVAYPHAMHASTLTRGQGAGRVAWVDHRRRPARRRSPGPRWCKGGVACAQPRERVTLAHRETSDFVTPRANSIRLLATLKKHEHEPRWLGRGRVVVAAGQPGNAQDECANKKPSCERRCQLGTHSTWVLTRPSWKQKYNTRIARPCVPGHPLLALGDRRASVVVVGCRCLLGECARGGQVGQRDKHLSRRSPFCGRLVGFQLRPHRRRLCVEESVKRKTPSWVLARVCPSEPTYVRAPFGCVSQCKAL